MKPLSPIAARFTRGLEGYVHPKKLDAWEQAAAGPESAGISWPGSRHDLLLRLRLRRLRRVSDWLPAAERQGPDR